MDISHRNNRSRPSHTNYEQQIIREAALEDKMFQYNKVEPTAYFWKELVAIQKDTPICLIPDTLVLNEK